MKTRHALVLCFGAAVLHLAAPSSAQCPEWAPGFAVPGTSSTTLAMATFDDGTGPALFIGGAFTSAGDKIATHIVKWDGISWAEVAGGVNGTVRALCVFDDGLGDGPALYVGGDFTAVGEGSASANRIARWDGTSWSPLGSGMEASVRALTVSIVGGTPALFAGGDFTNAGGTGANRVARWDGNAWSSLGTGTNDSVSALANFDDGLGGGAALYVGGEFTLAGGAGANFIARWNGTSWSTLGTGLNFETYALATYDDGLGGGTELYVGGHFNSAGGGGGNHIAKWNGMSWMPLPPGLNEDVRAFAVYDDGLGGGPKLAVGGDFTATGTNSLALQGVAFWDGATWTEPDTGIDNPSCSTLAVFDDGPGSRLFAGGSFDRAGSRPVSNIAAFDGQEWARVGVELGFAFFGGSLEAATSPPDAGATLYAVTGATKYVARLIAGVWEIIARPGPASPTSHFDDVVIFDDGSGPSLFVTGGFDAIGIVSARSIAKWNGSSWSNLGNGLRREDGHPGFGEVVAPLVIAGGQEELYVGGRFFLAGSVIVNNIARWNGSGWASCGTGTSGRVNTIASFDDGTGGGPDLYVGGAFLTAGGVSAERIAKWDGAMWSALGAGLDGAPSAFAVFDDGSGPALYVGGTFTAAGGVFADNIAKWNGTDWSALGTGVNAFVRELLVFDDGTGSGPALYVGGAFTSADGVPARGLAKWNGTSWSAVADDLGVGSIVSSMTAFHDGSGSGPDLYVAGTFVGAGATASQSLAKLTGCGGPGNRYCFGDGLDPIVTAQCPCGNFGDAGRGCANSNGLLGGALLTATGMTSPNTVLLNCSGVPNNTLCTFMRGMNHDPAGAVFGDGIKCLTSPLLRFGSQNSGQIGNPPHTVEAAAPSEIPGTTFHYVVQYRTPIPVFCPPATFNASNGYTISW